MDLLLAIDLGTQSTRAAVLDLRGQIVALSSSAEQVLHMPQTGWAEQDPELWWRHVCDTVQVCLQKTDAARIAAVGVSGQMHGCVPLDRSGKLLSRKVQLWCDKRNADAADRVNARLDASVLHDTAANMALANWHGLKISWLRAHDPGLYDQTWIFLTPKDFINYRLTAELATDFSEASGSFMMDANSREWSRVLTGALGIDLQKLPPISRSADIIGSVQGAAAEATGLRAGTPVVAGGGDMLCMLLAAGLSRPGIASDITGTSSIFSVFTQTPVADRRIMNLHHVLDGWVPFGLLDSGGVSLRWFRDAFCTSEVEAAKAQGVSSYALLADLAASSTPDAGLLFLPHLLGERTLGSPHTRASFFGLTPQHGVADMVRALMAGVTFDLKRVLGHIEAEGFAVDTVYHSGGGAKSRFWSQLKADIYQKPVTTFASSEGGILGAAILAATGAGLFESEAAGAAQCLQFADTFEPDAAKADFYEHQFARFVRVHDLLQAEFISLAAEA